MINKKRYDIVILTDFYPGFIIEEELELKRKNKNYLILTEQMSSDYHPTANVQLLTNVHKYSYLFTTLYSLYKFGSLNRIFLKTKYNVWLKFKSTFIWVQKAYGYFKQIESLCIMDESTVIYSFWGDEKAICAVLVKKKYKSKSVVRFHGWDLYHERHQLDKIPLRPVINQYIDNLVFISKNGLNYYIDEFNEMTDKAAVHYLGTRAPFEKTIPKTAPVPETLVLVSCSFLVAVKRIDVLFQAVSELIEKGVPIIWHHLGGGNLLADFKSQIERNNWQDKITFHGNLSNDEVHAFLSSNHIDLFINVSESEGLPVSMMEAMSYGIPCIGPDVGGISEIIVDGVTGFLMKPVPDTAEIAERIQKFIALDKNGQSSLKENSRLQWQKNFDSSINSHLFYEKILN